MSEEQLKTILDEITKQNETIAEALRSNRELGLEQYIPKFLKMLEHIKSFSYTNGDTVTRLEIIILNESVPTATRKVSSSVEAPE